MSGLTDDVEMGTAEEQAEEVVMQDSNYNSPDSDMTHLLDDPEDQHEQQEVDDIAADALMRDDDAGRPEQASSSSSSGKRVDGKGPTPMSTLSTGAADEDESKDLDMQLLLEGMRKKGQQQGKQDLFDLKGTTGKGTSKSKADAILAKGKKMMLLDKMKGGKGNKRPAQPPSPDELLDTHDSNIRGPVIDALKSSPDLQPPVDGNVKEGQHDMPPPKNKTQSKSEDYSQSKKAKVSPSNNNISASSKNKKGPTSTTPAVLDLFQDLQDLKGNNKNSKDNPQDSGGTAKRRTLFEQFATRFRREDYDLDADESSPMETDGQEGNEDEDSVDADEREEKRREEIEKEKRKVFHSMMNLPEEAQNIYDYVIWNNPFPTITRDDVKKAKDMNNSATKWLFALLPKFIASTKNVLKATGKCCITVTPSQALGKMPEKDANGRIVKWTSTWSLKQAAAENSFPNSEELGFDTRHGMHFYKASYGDFRSLSQIVSEKDKQVKAGASYIETAEGHSRVISYMFFNAMKNKKAQKDATLRKNMPKWRGFDEATQLQLPENYRNSISKIKLPSSTTATDSASSPTAAAATIAEENDLSYAEAFRSILLIFAKRVVPRQHKEDGGPPLFSAANGFITDVFPKLLQRHLQPGARRTFVDTWKRKYKCDENGDAAGTNIAKMTGGSKINI